MNDSPDWIEQIIKQRLAAKGAEIALLREEYARVLDERDSIRAEATLAEREACAKVADEWFDPAAFHYTQNECAGEIAAAIRGRKVT